MEKKYNTELDFILKELIVAYENHFKGVKFYTGETPKTAKEEINQKVIEKFGLSEWEINLLYHHLLVDNYIRCMDPLIISLDGLVFRKKRRIHPTRY